MTQSRDVVTYDPDTDINNELPVEPAKAAQYLLYIIVGLVVFTLLWASVARLDKVTRGQGRVVSSNQLQEVQYLEGGIVEEILVSAGDRVEAGALLVKLDPTQVNVEFVQGQEGYNALAARIAQLEAEAALKPLEFPAALSAAAPKAVGRARALYNARRAELDAALEIETSKLNQRRQTLEDTKVAIETAREAYTLAREEHSMMRNLVGKGIEPQVELLRAKQREAAARGEVQRADITINRTELEVAEVEGEINRIKKTFVATAIDELSKAKDEMADLQGALPALEDRVARTDVRSPVAGVVNRVLVSTIGGVVEPGETIVEVVPSDDSLVVEAKIKTADIGFLRIGQDAKVSLTAYDASVYGSMKAKIENISPDAIFDELSGDYFYNIRVRTNDEKLLSRKGEFRILPGMAAEVAVLNGKRTVMAYIMKPLADIGDKALQDK